MSQFAEALQAVTESANVADHPFYSFEPWDVEKRPQWILERAAEDEIDLEGGEFSAHLGASPHTLQTGFIAEKKHVQCLQAGTQIGKSMANAVKAIMMLTGMTPIAFRYEKGADTGYQRPITPENIIRWGRIDKATGTVIDHDIFAERNDSWDCGNIIGAGIFSKDMVCPFKNGRVWVGCYAEHRHQTWVPRFRDLIPERTLDLTRGKNGFNEREGNIYLTGGREINIISYEQGNKGFESRKVWLAILDEEPPTEKIYDSAITHCYHLALSFTPYSGITWSKERIFDRAASDANIALYHATQYDSPYLTQREIETAASGAPSWERVARIWGLHSDQVGAPYFNRTKLNQMKKYIKPMLYMANFIPNRQVDHPVDIAASEIEVREVNSDNGVDTFEVYEEVISGEAYFCCADTAKGSADPRDTKDRSVGYAFRATSDGKYMDSPVMVAAIRSRADIAQFSMLMLYCCAYYNNAMLAPESKSETGGAFIALTRDWPHYYKMTVINDETMRPTEHLGFDTNARTRTPSFELIKVEIADAMVSQHDYRHAYLLKELSEAVKGKSGRPDHSAQGTLDCGIAYAISRWVWKYGKQQIHCNKNARVKKKVSSWERRVREVTKQPDTPCVMMGYNQ